MLSKLLSPFITITKLFDLLVKLLDTLIKILETLRKSFAEKITVQMVNFIVFAFLIFAAEVLAVWLSNF